MRTLICTNGTSIARGVKPLAPHADTHIYRVALDDRVERVRAQTADEPSFLAQVAAETHSLMALDCGPGDRVVLLHSETDDGRVCAETVGRIVEQSFGCPAEPWVVRGMQVSDAARFGQLGVGHLRTALHRLHKRSRREGRQTVLNATGGFKAMVSCATIYGLLLRLRVVYLFERSQELIQMPPIDVDRVRRGRSDTGDQIDLNLFNEL